MQIFNPFRRASARPEIRRQCFAAAVVAAMTGASAAASPADIGVRAIETPAAAARAGSPLSLSLVFDPALMTVAQTTSLTLTIVNSGSSPATLTTDFVNTLPAGIVNTGQTFSETNCAFEYAVTQNSLSVWAGEVIPPATSCFIKSTQVEAATPGSYTNTIPAGALQTDQGSNAAASATLVVTGTGLSSAQSFAPASVTAGSNSRLTITLNNAGTVPATLSQPFVKALPSQLEAASVPNAATTCPGGSVTTTRDTLVLSSGAAIPVGGSCELAFDVASPLPGSYASQIPAGALQTSVGTNAEASTATLTVTPGTGAAPALGLVPAMLDLSAAADSSASAALTLANAPGSNPLTYAIAPRLTSANPAAPWTSDVLGGVETFMIDDGSIEGMLGLSGGGRTYGSVWLNRFSVTHGLTVDTITIYWPSTLPGVAGTSGLMLGMQPNLVVYYDAAATGSPANAVRVGIDKLVTIGVLDAFQTYATNFVVPGAGDVYIGFVDQWAVLVNGYDGVVYPAPLDSSSPPQQRSWLSGSTDPSVPADLVDLSNNSLTARLEDVGSGGNWLIRATGSDGGGGACSGLSAGWLSSTPSSGWVNGGGEAVVQVVADPAAGNLAEGTYLANLCVSSNDPDNALTPVPVSLTVTAPICAAKDTVFCNGFDTSKKPGADALR